MVSANGKSPRPKESRCFVSPVTLASLNLQSKTYSNPLGVLQDLDISRSNAASDGTRKHDEASMGAQKKMHLLRGTW